MHVVASPPLGRRKCGFILLSGFIKPPPPDPYTYPRDRRENKFAHVQTHTYTHVYIETNGLCVVWGPVSWRGTRRLHVIYAEKKNTIDGGRQNGSAQFPAQGLRVPGAEGGTDEFPSRRRPSSARAGGASGGGTVETNSFTAAGAPPVPGRPTRSANATRRVAGGTTTVATNVPAAFVSRVGVVVAAAAASGGACSVTAAPKVGRFTRPARRIERFSERNRCVVHAGRLRRLRRLVFCDNFYERPTPTIIPTCTV